MSVMSDKHFHDEHIAYEYVEARLWPNGPTCPHCGNADAKRITKLRGESTRIGVHKCKECRKPFTVKVGTVFESSHIPLRYWLQAMHLIASSKKGISSNQLHRILGVTLKSAWFLSHRIREAMRDDPKSVLGGEGSTVEVDETFIGNIPGIPQIGIAHKNVVLTLVEREGKARSFHVDSTSIADIMPVVKANVAKETAMMTDTASQYRRSFNEFASHGMVNHGANEYVRGHIHTNTVEGFYSIFKRGMKGVYQHCSENHLHRYLAEFDFRYSYRVKLGFNDVARADKMLAGVVGKRLTYRRVGE